VRTRRCSTAALSRGFSVLESIPAMVLNSGSKRCLLKVFSHSLKAIISRLPRCHSPSAGSRPRANEKRVYTSIPPADQRLRLSPRFPLSLVECTCDIAEVITQFYAITISAHQLNIDDPADMPYQCTIDNTGELIQKYAQRLTVVFTAWRSYGTSRSCSG
jgi:hypothetical protein